MPGMFEKKTWKPSEQVVVEVREVWRPGVVAEILQDTVKTWFLLSRRWEIMAGLEQRSDMI